MALPTPIPDNPLRWDGWKNYNSDDYYARLCLSYESNPSADQIEENCRQLLIWWQKKLPLKNQPSNPLAQMLRGGMDEAPSLLAEARTKLLDKEARATFDQVLQKRILAEGLEEFKKILEFAIGDKKLREEDERRLIDRGRQLGLSHASILGAIETELIRLGAERIAAVVEAPPPPPPPQPVAPAGGGATEPKDPFDEFRRTLRMSRLCLDGEEMSDDQRDTMCNIGESMGLTGGQAEDLIDEYLEEMSNTPMSAQPQTPRYEVTGRGSMAAVRPQAAPAPAKKPEKPVSVPRPTIQPSPVSRAHERQIHPNFTNSIGMEMRLVTSGSFLMGSDAPDAAPQEQPVTPVSISCFFMSRFPITNAIYELFDPSHRTKRAPWADESHPVVYVSARDAEKFCTWLTSKQGRRYRLPTEAEWEYAAKGLENRAFPWGDKLDNGSMANFADKRTAFAWRDPNIDDGYAETSPVGKYPRGASPFGLEDMAGNVFEWCYDCFEAYKGKERVNPRGNPSGQKRTYRGGSWKSRAGSLRASARSYNLPDYLTNDVGFRVVCDCIAP